MKTKLLTITLLSAFLITLAGCGGETTVSAPPESSAPTEQATNADVISYDNRALCGNEKVDVALKEISRDGITLTITNKTSDTITIMQQGLALDGLSLYTNQYALLYEDLIPETTVEVLVPYELDNIEHQTMSGSFELSYIDEQGYGYTDSILSFNNVDLGYDPHPIWRYPDDNAQAGDILYEDDQLTCRFYRLIDNMFVVTAENKSDAFFQIMPNTLVVNGKVIEENNVVTGEAMPGCTTLVVAGLPDDVQSSDIETIAVSYQLFDQSGAGFNTFSFNMTIE